jgi:invasion protein IalB
MSISLRDAGLCALIAATQVSLLGSASAEEKTKASPAAPAAQPVAPAQAGSPPPANPPQAQAQGEQAHGWAVQCANSGAKLECKARQTIVMAKTRQLPLSVSMSKPADGKDIAMLLHLPHFLFNPAGVAVGVDEAAPETLQIQTCDAQGCYAGAPVTSDELAALSKGAKLNVTFQDLKKQKIIVPVPLKGLDEALKKL